MKAESIASPIDDLTFDLVTVLHEKAEALEAYTKYLDDAEGDAEIRELFERIRQADMEHVQALKEALARHLEDELAFEEAVAEEEEEEEEDEEEEGEEGADEELGEEVEDVDEAPGLASPRRGESTQRR